MHSPPPPPPPSPSPSPSASLPESSSANEILDHVAHLGSAEAWPKSLTSVAHVSTRNPTVQTTTGQRGLFCEPRDRYLAANDAATTFGPLVEHQDFEPHVENPEYFLANGSTLQGSSVEQDPGVHQPSTSTEFAASGISFDLPNYHGASGFALPTMAVQAAFDPSPAMVADMTNPAWALGHPSLLPWDPNNMYLNNPQVMQPQPINNGFYSVDNYPPLSVGSATNPFDFGSPVLPTPVQAPRPPAFCTLCPASFTRYSDYQRHYESVHMGIKWHCFWPGCSNNRGNGYCRAEKLKTHQRRVHGLA